MAASDPSLCKTPLGETRCLGNSYFTTHSYIQQRKKVNFFYNNLGIHGVIICFTIGLYITKKEQFSAFFT